MSQVQELAAPAPIQRINPDLPRVLVVGARGIPDAEGGAEKNAEALFPRLAELGYDITLMGLKDNIRSSSYKGVTLKAAPKVRLLKTDKIAYYFAALGEAIRINPDIVHLQGLGSAIFLWAYKLLGKKVVVRYGSADYILSKWGSLGRWGFLFSEWQMRFADAVISVTPSLSRRLAEKGIVDNVHLIPNALDPVVPAKTDTPTQARPYILMVGRVTGQKNVAALMQAFRLFGQSHPDHDLVIAGGLDDAEYVQTLRPLTSERTIFLGRVQRSSVPALLRGAQLFVNVSLHEGSSNATLEAISYETPVLLSAIPENLDIDLPAHIYVDPSDPVAIAAGLEKAISDPDPYRLDKARFLTWEQVRDKTDAIYRSIYPARRGRA
jgi:glycosyltransferase involved in cell wall biosynthesis